MKKLSTLFLMAFVALTISAQQATLTEVWHNSTRSTATDLGGTFLEGSAPSWMGSTTERGMVMANGKMYVASRNGDNNILVLDGATGNLLQTLALPADPVSGGVFAVNSIDATASGNLIIGNLAGNTQSTDEVSGDPNGHFKAYYVELNASKDGIVNVTNIVNWHNVGDTDNPGFRMGDGIAFYGDMEAGTTGYLVVAPAGTNYIVRWNFNEGAATTTDIFKVKDVDGTPVNFATAPQLEPVSNDLVIVDGNNMFPIAYDMSSADATALETVASFSGAVTPQTSNLNGVAYFEFKGRYFMVCVTNYWNDGIVGVPINSFEAFEFTDGDWAQATSLGFLPADGLSATTATKNVSFAYPCAAEVLADKVMIGVLSANMGAAVYELTISEATAIGDTEESTVDMYPNPATDYLKFTAEMAEVQVYDLAGKLVKKAYSVKEISVADLGGIYLVKGIDAKGNGFNKKLIVK
ncbi:T9SS type A sorting domain-containing protein [Carboxylicivirga sp. RSCT41]|uniref:T9SS type A sorting domain-containing protein n=1 Tax=Carboxylicivirga agarovorans TaxID=3417570 RepID=UPI003D34E9E4